MGLFDFFSGKNRDKENIPIGKGSDLLENVEVLPGMMVPRAFANHWSEIEKSKMTTVSAIAIPTDDLALEQSKFGHYPCMPLNFDYPKDSNGNFMYPLAQINFKEVPALQGYPSSGYLQFYISGDDDVYGLDFNDPQSQTKFRVLFFEESEVEKYKADFSFLDEVMTQSEMSPLNKPHALSFTLKDEYVGIGDVRLEESRVFNLSNMIDKFPSIKDSLEEFAYTTFQSSGHKIGGYAYFTQTDPRSAGNEFGEYILLLQIDSDKQIMWGDVGVANFFIHPDDLSKKDFSKVMYNWDCS